MYLLPVQATFWGLDESNEISRPDQDIRRLYTSPSELEWRPERCCLARIVEAAILQTFRMSDM